MKTLTWKQRYQRTVDYREVFLNSEAGKRVWKDLVRKSGFLRDDINHANPEGLGAINLMTYIFKNFHCIDDKEKTENEYLNGIAKSLIVADPNILKED